MNTAAAVKGFGRVHYLRWARPSLRDAERGCVVARFGFAALLVLFTAVASAAGDVVVNPGKHPNPNVHARLTPDGKTVVTVGSDRCVRVWDAGTGEPLAELWLPE